MEQTANKNKYFMIHTLKKKFQNITFA